METDANMLIAIMMHTKDSVQVHVSKIYAKLWLFQHNKEYFSIWLDLTDLFLFTLQAETAAAAMDKDRVAHNDTTI